MPHDFFPLSSESSIVQGQTLIAQEFHVYDENMLAATFFYMAEKVQVVWKTKAKAIESKHIYIGG
jgi:hypothetical protein